MPISPNKQAPHCSTQLQTNRTDLLSMQDTGANK